MMMSQLKLRQKIGQMVVCGFDGHTPSDNITTLIEQYAVGGIIYFRRNLKDVKQVYDLSMALHNSSSRASTLPLTIAIDQEGGMVARLDRGITLMPGQMALGATRNVQGVYNAAYHAGLELRMLGINMNYAPCLDVNNNHLNPVIGVRSFGEDAELVSNMGVAAVRGYQAAALAATVKHFPGHGDTLVDSHLDLPLVPHKLERLHQIELAPFVKAIESGVDAVMTAHVIFPAIDPERIPATVSTRVLTGLLREQLGFNGVIITDCLEMNAIAQGVGVAEGAVAAIEAGADQVLISHTFERQVAGIEALLAAVTSGRLSEERIDRSVRRIIEMKQRRHMHLSPPPFAEVALRLKNGSAKEVALQMNAGSVKDMAMEMNAGSAKEVAQDLSANSITLVKDEGRQLPLDAAANTYVVWTQVRQSTQVDEVIEQEETLGRILNAYMSHVEEDGIGIEPTLAEIARVVEKSGQYTQLVFVSYNATFHKGQQQLIAKLSSMEHLRLIVVAARNPFDLVCFPQVNTYLATYENRPLAMRSLAKVLLGMAKPRGKLPVTISEQYAYGHSLS